MNIVVAILVVWALLVAWFIITVERCRRMVALQRPCPLCDCDDLFVDDDGWALCMECRASFELVRT